MIHDKPHEQAGERFTLTLLSPDPSGVLYDGLVVEVVDWQDRVTGISWGVRSVAHPLIRAYRARVPAEVVDDADVVAVTSVGTGTRLVHPTELARRL